MRVFVLCTGRCGSLSFATACRHITNYTSAHQTYTQDLVFPDSHIEVSPPLHTCIDDLVRLYPDSKFVHLIRDEVACVQSLMRLDHGTLMNGFRMLYYPLCGESRVDCTTDL